MHAHRALQRRRATQHNITPSATASGFSNPAPTVNVASAASLSPKTVKVGSYVVGWYVFNIIFNILNKSCLNVFPAPWFLATFQLCASATFMVALWLSGIQRRPQVSKELITALVPVAFWHTVGHVSACVAFSQVAVSFTHVVKSAEPVLSVILSQVLLKEAYPAYVWASLIPIVAGCSLAAVNEVSFAWSGFNNAMISNLGMVMRNIYSKKYLDQFKSLDGINLFALLSIISIFITLPAALYVEGFKGGVYQWGAMADAATASLGGDFVLFMRLIVGSGIFYHLYNQVGIAIITMMIWTRPGAPDARTHSHSLARSLPRSRYQVFVHGVGHGDESRLVLGGQRAQAGERRRGEHRLLRQPRLPDELGWEHYGAARDRGVLCGQAESE